jgi:hypothetical protein
MRTALLFAAVVLTAAAPAPKSTSLLSARDLDPALVLPPPPVTGSAQAQAELAELHAIEASRTPAEEAAARADGENQSALIFTDVLGPRFDLAKLPATAQLMRLVKTSESAVVDRGKDYFKRPRPFVVDAALNPCKINKDPLSSDPSGHTSMAFSMGETLAHLVPEKAGPILARAARYGQSRVVCGQHFRSDVSAGQMLGLLIAERLMTQPAFRAAFTNARRELVAQGVAAR